MDELIDLKDASALIRAADEELCVALLLSYHAGLSSIELAALKWADVDLKKNTVRIGRGLGVRLREVPLHAVLQERLPIFRGGRAASEEVFRGPGAVTRLREKLRATGGPRELGHVSFRDFQKRFFDISQQASVELAVFAYLVGNKQARSYVLYTKSGRMRDIPLENFRKVVGCFKSLLKEGA